MTAETSNKLVSEWANEPYQPVQVIFNPFSGVPGDSGPQLLELLSQLQAMSFLPEVFLLSPNTDLSAVVQRALDRGIRFFVVSGGDGTIDSVAALLAVDANAALASPPVLAIIPTGTQNNIALSLHIPTDIRAAAALLRSGVQVGIDMALAECSGSRRIFLEACSVGLFSALFSAADDIQHGNIQRITDLLSTLVTFPLSDIYVVADDLPEIHTRGHVALVSNMPYVGPHFSIPNASGMDDGSLDVLVFNDLSKLDLLSYATLAAGSLPDQTNIQNYHVKKIVIQSHPPMPVLADGFSLGETPLSIRILPKALTVIRGPV